jgi:hypothetical protein
VPAVPVLIPPVSPPVLAQPYLTAAQFTAYPHWLDVDNLIPGAVLADQADTLTDVLIGASVWCDEQCGNMRLSAHYVQGEQQRARMSAAGRVYFRPRDIPLRQIVSLSYGYDPTAMIADVLPDPSLWVEDGRQVSFAPGGSPQNFTGPAIQFGARLAPEVITYINWSYVPGFPSTVLTAGLTTSSTSVTVADPTGIMPGDVLRIYDQGSPATGASEALTIAPTYVPQIPTVPPTPTAVPIVGNPAFAHASGTGITGMPRGILQAVICYTIAMLLREDVQSETPASRFGAGARTAGTKTRGGQAGGLINDAQQLLAPFAPVLR